ncbi:MAG: hypothetical protein WDM76_13385 [Limisphaerales bacterium]
MNSNTENSDAPKKCGKSIVRKAQILGVYVGGLGTLAYSFIKHFRCKYRIKFWDAGSMANVKNNRNAWSGKVALQP